MAALGLTLSCLQLEAMEVASNHPGDAGGLPSAIRHPPRVPDALLNQLRARFERPSPIQAQAWPILLRRHDLVGIAETGRCVNRGQGAVRSERLD